MTGGLGMDTTAELARRTKADDTDGVAVFLAEEGDGPHLLCLFERCVAMFVERDVLSNHIVDKAFHLAQFFVGHLLEV